MVEKSSKTAVEAQPPSAQLTNGVEATTKPVVTPRCFTLSVQPMINEYHLKHGLRHNDYFRYRGYCSRRIEHIRKSLKFTQQCHKKKDFQKRTITNEIITDVRFLELLLLLAERAWAHAMQLKDEAELEPRRNYHVTKKLGVACETSNNLLELCVSETSVVDARTKLEVKAYHAFMEATYAFELRDYKTSMSHFNNCVAIYENIRGKLSENPDNDTSAYDSKVSDIKPLVNFCAYNLGEDVASVGAHNGVIESDLSLEFEEKMKLAQSAPGGATKKSDAMITWIGNTVNVQFEFLQQFFTTLNTCTAEISKAVNEEAKITILDNLLDQTRQVQAKLKEEMKNTPTSAKDAKNPKEDSEKDPILFLLGYVTFIKLSNGIQKNIMFLYNLVQKEGGSAIFSDASRSIKPQAVLKFFETSIDFLDEMLALEVLKNAEQEKSVLKAQKSAFISFRDFQLGRCFGGQQEWKPALALFTRSKETASVIKLPTLTLEFTAGNLIGELLKNLLSYVDTEIYSAYTSCITSQYAAAVPSTPSQTKIDGPLDENLDTWVNINGQSLGKLQLTKLPPDMKPVPAKPLFFDIASNHVVLPGAVQEKVTATQKGGLGGYLRGWWGSGAKK